MPLAHKPSKNRLLSKLRYIFIAFVLLVGACIIVARIADLSIFDRGFLLHRGQHESTHTMIESGHRGTIVDRNGVPLAISVPINNIIFDPKTLVQNPNDWQKLANIPALDLNLEQIKQLILKNPNSRFIYAKKNVPPQLAAQIVDQHIPGVYRQYLEKSYYPTGDSSGQLVGFTNQNNQGQDGIELSYQKYLRSSPGQALVTEDALGDILSINKIIKAPHDGKPIKLSIDAQIQYFAYQAIKAEVQKVKAQSGAVAVIDPKTGEVLAAASYPGFNPNQQSDRAGPGVRDRSITDLFEPGSTMKAFTISAGLESGKYTPDTLIDTNPGYYMISGHKIKDDANFGIIDVTHVLQKSSNVGATKIALSIDHQVLYNLLLNAGISSTPGGHFPGEASGNILPFTHLSDLEYATMAFGYAMSTSTLQLARAYTAFANHGTIYPTRFVTDNSGIYGDSILKPKTADEVKAMLHTVVQEGGTGLLANIPGYEVAGKTGTTNKVGPHGFYKHRYNAIFAGLAPLKDPRLVIVVQINDPQGGHFSRFGGVSAAPVFAQVAGQALRVMGVEPTQDQVDQDFFKHEAQFAKLVAKA